MTDIQFPEVLEKKGTDPWQSNINGKKGGSVV